MAVEHRRLCLSAMVWTGVAPAGWIFDGAVVPCDGDWRPLCGLGAVLSKAAPWPTAEAGLM